MADNTNFPKLSSGTRSSFPYAVSSYPTFVNELTRYHLHGLIK
jgi:hypothetical protein